MYWGLDTFYGVIRIVSKTPPSPSGVFEKCLRHPNGGLQPRAPPAQIGYWKPLLPRFCLRRSTCTAAEARFAERTDWLGPDPARCFDCPVDPAPADDSDLVAYCGSLVA